MKYIVVADKFDTAGRNILTQLLDLEKFDYSVSNGSILDSANLDLEKISKYDMVIFASKHKSETKEKTLSLHAPGNFREVWGGGKEGRLNHASALFQKYLFQKLNEEKEKSGLTRYNVTLECTHHGPLIDVPCVFIEVGGTEEEWKDKKATFVVAKAIREAILTYKPNPYNEIAFGIGGPHYCPAFNKLQLDSNVAIAHIIPKYVSPITEEMILQAFNQTIEEIDFAVIDWKGVGKAEDRDKIIEILEKNYIPYKKVSEIKR
ncbi:hypothetical protein GW932_00425 [archaeon]|nr:hypothetical protein [archaeon]